MTGGSGRTRLGQPPRSGGAARVPGWFGAGHLLVGNRVQGGSFRKMILRGLASAWGRAVGRRWAAAGRPGGRGRQATRANDPDGRRRSRWRAVGRGGRRRGRAQQAAPLHRPGGLAAAGGHESRPYIVTPVGWRCAIVAAPERRPGGDENRPRPRPMPGGAVGQGQWRRGGGLAAANAMSHALRQAWGGEAAAAHHGVWWAGLSTTAREWPTKRSTVASYFAHSASKRRAASMRKSSRASSELQPRRSSRRVGSSSSWPR